MSRSVVVDECREPIRGNAEVERDGARRTSSPARVGGSRELLALALPLVLSQVEVSARY